MMSTANQRQRVDLAVKAAYEVESISRVLQAEFQQVAASEWQYVRGLAIRLETLAAVVMAVGHDDPITEALNALEGPEAVRRRLEAA